MGNAKVTMTLLVRNEDDVLEDNIWFHRFQGVDSFIVMDNLSADRTADIVRNIAREIEVEYLYQDADDYSQSDWVTAMARKACLDHHADWVINNDADEFWVTESGTLKAFVVATSPELSVLRARRHNAVLSHDKDGPLLAAAHPKSSEFFERDSVNSLGRPLPRKCIHRASPSVIVGQGNHAVTGLAGGTAEIGDAIRILHYPYRSLTHYKRKIRVGGAAYHRNSKLPLSVGATWREHYRKIDTGEVDRFWAALSKPRQAVLIDQLEGKVFQDRTVVDFIANRAAQTRQARLQDALARLRTRTQALVDDFVQSQTKLITKFAEPERKRRPLYYNLQFCLNGPLRHLERVSALSDLGPNRDLCRRFADLRDIVSLFPRNLHLRTFLGEVLSESFPDDVARLRTDCGGKRVILHVSCTPRYRLAEQSIESFQGLDDGYHHLVVVGAPDYIPEDATELSVRYDGRTLTVPVPDDYENLHRKIFYALTMLHLVADAALVLKVDDNIRLQDASVFERLMSSLASDETDYAGRLIGSETHQMQWHGWHLSKCNDPEFEARGYQYPLPRRYAAGGYGYVLGRRGVEACAYMYLAMKEFFAMRTVGLEDAYVGHAMHAQGLELRNVGSEKHLLAFPGLATTDEI